VVDLRKYGNVPLEYKALKLDLSSYQSPKDKIDSLVREGLLIRLKKGWYVVSKEVSQQPYCRGSIANTLHGPSYVSLETALSYYGLIPESVYTTFSVTSQRAKKYSNEIGVFQYEKAPLEYYRIGMTTVSPQLGCSYLQATPEKAICDKLYFTRGLRIQSNRAMREFLFEDMRMDFSSLENFDFNVVDKVIEQGKKTNLFKILREVLRNEFRG